MLSSTRMRTIAAFMFGAQNYVGDAEVGVQYKYEPP